MTIQVRGLKELDFALAELPKATAKNVMLRTLKKAGQPIADAAKAYAPVDTGELRDSIIVTAKSKNNVGKSEFAQMMKSGGSRAEARAALIGARRAQPGKSFAQVYVGPAAPTKHKKKNAIKRIAQEFGSVRNAPHPYLRPAWEAHKNDALSICTKELGNEIIMAAKRLAKRKSASADMKYRASLGALMAYEASQ